MSDRLSLRSRLLLAVGTVALVALIVADVAVYASLKSYLYRQVDSTLEASYFPVLDSVAGPPGGHPPGPTSGHAPGQSTFCLSAPGMFIEARSATNSVVSGELCPAFAAGKSYSPKLPAVLTGFAATAEDRGDRVA